MKPWLKALIGERGRAVVRRFGRLRYLTKARKAHEAGWSFAAHPRGWLTQVVISPEIDTYTYDLANEDELARTLADVLARPVAEVQAALAEAHQDPELGAALARDVGYRVLWLRRRPGLAGHHLSMWVAVRLMRPGVVVETGILDGLGSRTILRALQRNAEEGHEGRLFSFDVLPSAGVLVSALLRERWTRIIEPSARGLDGHLAAATVDLFLHDSLPTPELERFELDWALRHGCRLAVSTHAWSGVAASLADARGVRSATFTDRPVDHFFAGRQLAYVAVPRHVETSG